MKSVLDELYSGRLYPAEQIVPRDPKYFPLCKKIDEEMEYFKQKLSPEDKIRFEEMGELNSACSSMCMYEGYAYGVRLGALLMCEIFTGDAKTA